jgi:glycine/D-amino acid oxidase-like deaminating enzyme
MNPTKADGSASNGTRDAMTSNIILPPGTDQKDYDVIVIGAGLAGVSAVYHLVVVNGEGTTTTTTKKKRSPPLRILLIDAGSAPGEGVGPRKSGTATMKRIRPQVEEATTTTSIGATNSVSTSHVEDNKNSNKLSRIKMLNQMFECSAEEFVKHNGKDGARRYMQAAKEGLELQKKLARELGDDLLSEMGTYYVCFPDEYDELYEEYQFFKSLGESCQELEFMESMDHIDGASKDFPYAIYFPLDAVIDSSEYVKRLLDRSRTISGSTTDDDQQQQQQQPTAQVTTRFDTRVVQIQDRGIGPPEDPCHSCCTVTLSTGETLRAPHVIVATGALDPLPQLHGLLIPCYSYLAFVPLDVVAPSPKSSMTGRHEHDEENEKEEVPRIIQQSANFYTWSLGHDWCFDQGMVRVSGEDRMSAYKDPKVAERCGRMIAWIQERYSQQQLVLPPQSMGNNDNDDKENEEIPAAPPVQQQYGIYSETPDFVPLVGTRSDDSGICYLVGCNAAGQTILSYAASLVPKLLWKGKCDGDDDHHHHHQHAVVDELDESQKEALRLFSIRRFTQLPPL